MDLLDAMCSTMRGVQTVTALLPIYCGSGCKSRRRKTRIREARPCAAAVGGSDDTCSR